MNILLHIRRLPRYAVILALIALFLPAVCPAEDDYPETSRAFHMGIQVGSWHPLGSNKVLGNHLDLGFRLGSEGNFGEVNLLITVRTGKSKDYYSVTLDDSVLRTKDYLGGFAGAEYGLQLFKIKPFGTRALLGMGGDFLTSAKRPSNGSEKEFAAFAFFAGVEERWYLDEGRWSYCSLQIRYFHPFRNAEEAPELRGGGLTVSLGIGLLERVRYLDPAPR